MDNTIKPFPPTRPLNQATDGKPVGATPSAQEADSWFEAMAQAWGSALDKQAERITELSNEVGGSGRDNPSTITVLTAESLRMQFMASNASTANNSVGQALEALSRKQ